MKPLERFHSSVGCFNIHIMVKLVLYGVEASPPVRAVLLTLNALGLDYEFKEVNLTTGEHHSEDFLKKNPQHTVPVLDDNGHFLWDSHAIVAFLVRKYAKNDAFYPKDFYQRAVVDQRLHFESGVLFPSLRNITMPFLEKNETKVGKEKMDAVHEAYKFLETFLEYEYVAGKVLTIADFSFVPTVTSLFVVAPFDVSVYPKINAWIKRMSKLPFYEKTNGKGVVAFRQLFEGKFVTN